MHGWGQASGQYWPSGSYPATSNQQLLPLRCNRTQRGTAQHSAADIGPAPGTPSGRTCSSAKGKPMAPVMYLARPGLV